MISLKEELKQYKPLLEVANIEEEIEKEELEDILDIIVRNIKAGKE